MRKMENQSIWIAVVCVTMLLQLHGVQGVMTIQGCTESFIHMKCPGDDLVTVHDMRIEISNSTEHKCNQTRPPHQVAIPHELSHLCDNKQSHCVWIEDICEGLNECVFYVSPHLIDGKEQPNRDTEMIIEYECKPGKTRTAGTVILSLLIVVSTLAVLGVSAIILWKDFTSENYDNFTNETIPHSSSYNTTQLQASGPEHISVQLQSPNPVAAATPSVTT